MFYLGESQATLCRHSTQAVRSSSAHSCLEQSKQLRPDLFLLCMRGNPTPAIPYLELVVVVSLQQQASAFQGRVVQTVIMLPGMPVQCGLV